NPACSSLLADLLAQHPEITNLGVMTQDGTMTCSASPAGASSAPVAESVRQAVSSRGFTEGGYHVSPITGLGTFVCAFPILSPTGDVIKVVYAELSLGSLKDVATRMLPAGAVLTITDHEGTVLA